MKRCFIDFDLDVIEKGFMKEYFPIDYDDGNYFVCPFCQEIVYSTDYPFLEVDEETGHCICPICCEVLDV